MWSLLQAAQAVETRLEEALAEVDLSGPKFAALTHLVDAGEPVPLGELATQCACVRSNITQLIDRLEADKLVRRMDDAADRRSLRAAVTPLGRQRQRGARKVAAVRRHRSTACDRPDGLKRALAGLNETVNRSAGPRPSSRICHASVCAFLRFPASVGGQQHGMPPGFRDDRGAGALPATSRVHRPDARLARSRGARVWHPAEAQFHEGGPVKQGQPPFSSTRRRSPPPRRAPRPTSPRRRAPPIRRTRTPRA
jgi:DNA-binding MarR family transcriptional regulator